MGSTCRLGNPRACAEQGCYSQTSLEVRRAGSLVAASSTGYAGYASSNASTFEGWGGSSCLGADVTLTWDNTAANGCMNNSDGAIQYKCDGNSTTWSCRTVANTWQQLNYTRTSGLIPQRFYGLWSYGGTPSRTFNTDAEAYMFDANMLTDSSLVSVGQFDPTGSVVQPEFSAPASGPGWFIPYATTAERTGTPATVVDGCVLWNSFENSSSVSACSAVGPNISRLYQADAVSGLASCAQGLYSASTGTWARYVPFGTHVPLGSPAPQRLESSSGSVLKNVTLSTPYGSVQNYGYSSVERGPFASLPVTEGPP